MCSKIPGNPVDRVPENFLDVTGNHSSLYFHNFITVLGLPFSLPHLFFVIICFFLRTRSFSFERFPIPSGHRKTNVEHPLRVCTPLYAVHSTAFHVSNDEALSPSSYTISPLFARNIANASRVSKFRGSKNCMYSTLFRSFRVE